MKDLTPWRPRLVKKVIMKTLERKVMFCTWLEITFPVPVLTSLNELLCISEKVSFHSPRTEKLKK